MILATEASPSRSEAPAESLDSPFAYLFLLLSFLGFCSTTSSQSSLYLSDGGVPSHGLIPEGKDVAVQVSDGLNPVGFLLSPDKDVSQLWHRSGNQSL